tara:strand:+ start:6 stop:1094 length:1089 start_codon:yes stop_codon:yes gene_type:complete
MKKKISIIGGGIFGISIYLKLKSVGFDCELFETKKELLCGATTNNLNRIHYGFHYPRDKKTAIQSLKGYKSFKKFYKKSIIKNFPNYYLIAKNSKVSLKKYIKFCKECKLSFKKLDLKKFPLQTKKIEGGIKVKEPIYDWSKLKSDVKNKLKKLKKNKLYLNSKIIKIENKKNKFFLFTQNKTFITDIIIDATYNFSNSLTKNITKNEKYKYQLVFVKEFKLKNFKKLGIAVMDGKYFSFLPKGKSNNHILYHVKNSIIKEEVSNEFNEGWLNLKKFKKKIKLLEKKMFIDCRKFFPKINFNNSKKIYLSPRILLPNVEKTDKRCSEIKRISNNYYKIISGKIDHSVDIAERIKKQFKKSYS